MRAGLVLSACLALLAPSPSARAAEPPGTAPLTFVDLMKARQIGTPVLSENGTWAAWALWPDRGDGVVVVRPTGGASRFEIERGADPAITPDGAWVAARVRPALEEREAQESAGKEPGSKGEKKDGPHDGLALLSTADGAVVTYERVDAFAFSGDGRFLAVHHVKDAPGSGDEGDDAEAEQEEETSEEKTENEKEKDDGKKKDVVGTRLVLRTLAGGDELVVESVVRFRFSALGEYLAYAIAVEGGEGNGLFVRDLRAPGFPESAVVREAGGRYTHLAWPERGPRSGPERAARPRPAPGPAASGGTASRVAPRLAFVAAIADEDGVPGDGAVWTWDAGGARRIVSAAELPDGWFVPSANDLAWTKDGRRLFLGIKPVEEKSGGAHEGPENDDATDEGDGEGDGSEEAPFDPYDVDALLEERSVDVWHWNDPLIVPHQEKRWDEEKKRTYRAVWHADTGRLVPLADRTVREVDPGESATAAIGRADVPYLKRITWDGAYVDLYRVLLETGEKQLVARELRAGYDGAPGSLSPDGRFVVYYRDGHWHLFDGESRSTRNLTAAVDVPFADEDHDYPSPAPGYGVAGWVAGDRSVLIYDKFDIWEFPTDPASVPTNLTAGEGRAGSRVFRVVDLDDERDWLLPDEPLLLTAYHDREKHRGLWGARVGRTGVGPLIEEPRLYSFVTRAKAADRILVTRERYDEFPDLWVADLAGFAPDPAPEVPKRAGGRRDGGAVAQRGLPGLALALGSRLSDANPELSAFDLGAAELVEWTSDDGVPLEGVLIKPAGYEEGRRYPVLVYFYRFFSQRLHEFNEPVVNHRPSFPVYASDGYAVFLPDIRFEVGRPGFSATKCLVPGVKKLIDMGIADPDAIGLHGHSWSGYQAAFVVTQTDLFAAAVAGAPVSNMTSAYSGIRLGTGLARQFQYEKSQSRIGGTLWDARRLYIENSPVFFADRIETPLLIQFGDEDEAVPWQQGIELYLALRRLGKDAIFLQYRGEPHHLKQYPNKLDYSIRMKQFFDHHLKGAPAPAWMTEGVPYRGE